MKTFKCVCLTFIAATLFAQATYAQVEEITVSAQRRDANLQEVPISVSAFNVDDMEKLQILAVDDVAAAVPNMQTLEVTANGAAMQVFMRGTSIQNPGFNASESPVGLYVDDIYRGRLASANLDLTDIERIEVLRGPQGTLYGRNTIAGAVKFITRTPDDDFYADAAVSYGNFETSKITASVGGPLIEGKLAGSLAALYHDRGEGWIERGSVGGRKLGEFTNSAVRGKLHWYGGDVFNAELSLAYIDAENDGYNGIPYNGNPGNPIEGFYTTLVPDTDIGFGDTDQLNGALNLSWELDSITIRSITGYSDIDEDFGFDITAVGDSFITSTSNNKTISQEFTFSGDAFEDSAPFHWLAGLYYMNEEGDQQYNPNIPGFFLDSIEDVQTQTDSYAIYGEGTWDLTDKFSLTIGARVTRDENRV